VDPLPGCWLQPDTGGGPANFACGYPRGIPGRGKTVTLPGLPVWGPNRWKLGPWIW